MANDSDAPKGRAASALEAARERTTSAYEAARNRASEATRKANEQLSIYPISAVVGGFLLVRLGISGLKALGGDEAERAALSRGDDQA
jgi:hypothetical protein